MKFEFKKPIIINGRAIIDWILVGVVSILMGFGAVTLASLGGRYLYKHWHGDNSARVAKFISITKDECNHTADEGANAYEDMVLHAPFIKKCLDITGNFIKVAERTQEPLSEVIVYYEQDIKDSCQ